MYMACVGDAAVMAFNRLADRPNAHKIWDVVLKSLEEMVTPRDTGIEGDDATAAQNKWSTVNPRAEYVFKENMLAVFPDSASEFLNWETKTKRGPHVKRFMDLLRDPTRIHMVAEIALAAVPRIQKSIAALRNKDCSGIPELKNAPVNTDECESGIGGLDYLLYRTLANYSTVFGVQNANRMQISTTDVGKLVMPPLPTFPPHPASLGRSHPCFASRPSPRKY